MLFQTLSNKKSMIKTLITQTVPEILETVSEEFGQA